MDLSELKNIKDPQELDKKLGELLSENLAATVHESAVSDEKPMASKPAPKAKKS